MKVKRTLHAIKVFYSSPFSPSFRASMFLSLGTYVLGQVFPPLILGKNELSLLYVSF